MWRTQRTGGWRCETRPQGSSAGTRAEAERRAQGDRGGCQAGALRAVIQRGQVVRSGKQREKWESHRVWPSLKESTRRHQMCRWQVKTATGTAGKAGERWQQVSAQARSAAELRQPPEGAGRQTQAHITCAGMYRRQQGLGPPASQTANKHPPDDLAWQSSSGTEQHTGPITSPASHHDNK